LSDGEHARSTPAKIDTANTLTTSVLRQLLAECPQIWANISLTLLKGYKGAIVTLMPAKGDMDIKRQITGHNMIIADMVRQTLKEPGRLPARIAWLNLI